MELKKIILLIPALILIVSISGCTIPGMGQICIPFLPCEKVVELEDDVIVIKSLDAIPQSVSNDQQIRLVMYVQNVGKEPVPQDKLEKYENQKITVNLYDYCEGLFTEVKINCPGKETVDCKGEKDASNKPCICEIEKLLPGQIKETDWILKAGKKETVPLKTECDLKVSVTYPYKTTSLSTITFIDYHEMQNQINDGTFRKRDSYIVSGYGPVKPRIVIEDQQPIPVQNKEAGKTVINLKIKNSGNGYLCRKAGSIEGDTKTTGVICDSKIPKARVKVSGITGDLEYTSEGTCLFPKGVPEEDITLIKKESPSHLCEIELKKGINLPKETTEHVTVDIEYLYEFRKDIKVTIDPKI